MRAEAAHQWRNFTGGGSTWQDHCLELQEYQPVHSHRKRVLMDNPTCLKVWIPPVILPAKSCKCRGFHDSVDAALMPAQRKFDRCASAAALYDQRMKDFDAWCCWPCYNGDLQGQLKWGTVHENSHMKSSGVIRQSQINGKPMPVKINESSRFSLNYLSLSSGLLSLVKQHTSPHELATNFDVSLKCEPGVTVSWRLPEKSLKSVALKRSQHGEQAYECIWMHMTHDSDEPPIVSR